MLKKKAGFCFCITVVLMVFILQSNASGYDVTDKFSVGGVLAGAWQYLQADEDST